MADPKGDIALIGLAVMGQNIILNMNDHGYTVVAFNRTVSKVEEFLQNEAKGTKIIGATSLENMVSLLKKPRRVMLLVKAGSAVDAFIDSVVPLLEKGDIIIDGGNSEYTDTNRRYRSLREKGIHYLGCGVSGGEEGARYGPSLMPGGAEEAWPSLKPIFQSIAAKADGEPCCDWVGPEGAGHFVKMVHNGIEYGDMQLICEAYQLMKEGLGMSHSEMGQVSWGDYELEGLGMSWADYELEGLGMSRSEMGQVSWADYELEGLDMSHSEMVQVSWADYELEGLSMSHREMGQLMKGLDMSHSEMGQVFDDWNKSELESFLIEITRDIMNFKDTDGAPLVEKIRDSAGQKGTGKWTAISSLEYGVPVTLIGEAVFARCLSSLKDERVEASKQLQGPAQTKYQGDRKQFIDDIKLALYASKIVSYAQGFMLMREAAKELKWKLNFGSIALMWRGGCIIRR
ncbi:6-phosphogluconate dehydrogenase, decarboxylating-like [Plakobranchus ocellatus]|uniref:6-phosphogluconate dehydrogenase, decarboxylating n=1 Tax=Plakobranchus ocellatus TaxID=259542 RepID=A0AAV3Z8Z8_9GAST|nr:6-phosphogluconate dehydrogenase, decarboxylating-like [Plakobranchus ocellatus]